jgi:hypothetical protein
MTQALYAHMNNKTNKQTKNPEKKKKASNKKHKNAKTNNPLQHSNNVTLIDCKKDSCLQESL